MKKLPRLSPIAAAAKSAPPRPTLLPAVAAAAMVLSMNAQAQEHKHKHRANRTPSKVEQTVQAKPAEAAAQEAPETAAEIVSEGAVPAESAAEAQLAAPEAESEFAAAEQGDATTLPEVTATGQALDSYKPVSSSIGAKMPAAIRDIPQTVNIVNRALLDAQNATTLTDALRNVPGITMAAGEGGQIGDNVNLRGFTARTDIYLDGMRDRGQYKRDTFALESVEVLKGPSSLFFGRGSTGGVINQVGRTALQDNFRSITASVGTDGYYRATADINESLSDHAAYRVAAMIQDVDSTRDVVNNQDWGVAPSLRTALNDKTDLILSGLVQHNRDIPDYGVPFVFGRPAEVSNDRYFGDTDDYFDQDTYIAKVRLEHRFSPSLKLQNQFQGAETKLAARPTPYRVCTPAFDVPAGACPVSGPGTQLGSITVQSDRRDREIKDTSMLNQTDLVATFDTGTLKHALIGGVEIGRDETYNQGYTWSARVTQSLGNFVPRTNPGLTRGGSPTHSEGKAETLAFYANETLTLTPQWKLIAGVRHDRFEADAKTIVNATGAIQSTTIPPPPGSPPGTPATTGPNAFARADSLTSVRGGVVWQPSTAQSYYVSYGTSFNPSAEAITISAAQSAVPPEKTRSYEAGGRWEVAQEKLSLSAALFRVEKTDARTTDPTAANSVSLDGNTRVQGFELGAIGNISHSWQIITGYTFLDSELTKSKDVLTTTVGSTVITTPIQGNKLANTPEHSGSVWTTYKFLKSCEVGGGAYYTGKRYVTNSNVTSVDGYWRVDGTFAFHQPLYDLQLNVQNLLDEDYYDSIVASENGRAVPGRGRTMIVSATYKF